MDRLYFSTDYPFKTMEDAAHWFDEIAVVDSADAARIARENAIKLFRLEPARMRAADEQKACTSISIDAVR